MVYISFPLKTSRSTPFGSLLPGRSYQTTTYKYGFNGKENDNEVKGTGNQQDYGFRIYDPRLGKFLSVDPLTREYPWYTPYQFAGNMPIQAIDLDGLEENFYLLNISNDGGSIKLDSYNKKTLPSSENHSFFFIGIKNNQSGESKYFEVSEKQFSSIISLFNPKKENQIEEESFLEKIITWDREREKNDGTETDGNPWNDLEEKDIKGGKYSEWNPFEGWGLKEPPKSAPPDKDGWTPDNNKTGNKSKKFEEGYIYKNKKGDTIGSWTEFGRFKKYGNQSQEEKKKLKSWNEKKELETK